MVTGHGREAKGTLQEADTVTGPWTNIAGAASPYLVAPTAGKRFAIKNMDDIARGRTSSGALASQDGKVCQASRVKAIRKLCVTVPLAVAVRTGCTVVQEHVKLSPHKTPPGVTRVEGASVAKVKVMVPPVSESVTKMFGMGALEQKTILEGATLTEALRQAFASELTARGFVLVDGGGTLQFEVGAASFVAAGSSTRKRPFQNGSSRPEEALVCVRCEPRYLGCYGVLKEPRKLLRLLQPVTIQVGFVVVCLAIKMRVAYQKDDVLGGSHVLESDLKPDTIYYWSIRPSGTTKWSAETQRFLSVGVYLPGMHEVEQGFFMIRTPKQ
jgi:hypothetical protein